MEVADAPAQLDYLCDDCRAHFAELRHNLDVLDIAYVVDKNIVRGLDYYTRTVFEFVSDNVGTQGTICGGGRYDGLVEEFGGPATPAVGFALGVERLLLELEGQGVNIPEPPKIDLYVVSFPDTADEGLRLVQRLRRQGLACATDIMGRSMRAQMKYANRIDARYTLVLGASELESDRANVRKMDDVQPLKSH